MFLQPYLGQSVSKVIVSSMSIQLNRTGINLSNRDTSKIMSNLAQERLPFQCLYQYQYLHAKTVFFVVTSQWNNISLF